MLPTILAIQGQNLLVPLSHHDPHGGQNSVVGCPPPMEEGDQIEGTIIEGNLGGSGKESRSGNE